MLVIAATNIKSRLGDIFDDLERNPASSVLIERNKKPVAMLLPSDMGRQVILGAYAHGSVSRAVAMQQLGFEWYGQLLEAMAQAGIQRPVVRGEEQQAMVNAALEVLPRRMRVAKKS
jgi:hypothetical protein